MFGGEFIHHVLWCYGQYFAHNHWRASEASETLTIRGVQIRAGEVRNGGTCAILVAHATHT